MIGSLWGKSRCGCRYRCKPPTNLGVASTVATVSPRHLAGHYRYITGTSYTCTWAVAGGVRGDVGEVTLPTYVVDKAALGGVGYAAMQVCERVRSCPYVSKTLPLTSLH